MKRFLPAAGALLLAGAAARAEPAAQTQAETRTITLPGGGGSVTVTTTGGPARVKVVANGEEVEADDARAAPRGKARPGARMGGFLGVGSQPVSPEVSEHLSLPEGLYISVGAVQPESPADKAGLKKHDILTHLDDQLLVNPQQFQQLVRMRKAGDAVTVKYLRAGKEHTVRVTLAEREIPAVEAPVEPGFPGRRSPWQNPGVTDPFWGGGGLNPDELHERMRRMQEEALRNLPDPQAGGRVDQSSSRTSSMTTDDGTFTFTEKDGDKHFKAADADGKVLFDGAVNTEEERAKVPEDLRETLRQMENGQFKPNLKFFHRRPGAGPKGQAI